MVYRIYVEKKLPFAHEAHSLEADVRSFLGIDSLKSLRLFNRYDVEHINKLAEITICDIRSGKTAVAGRKDIEKLTCQLI